MNYIYSQPDKTNYVSVNTLLQPKKRKGTTFSPNLIQKKENNTGLPDNIKSNVESLSGISMDNVRVHYNSPKPAQIQALAYTQGTDILVAPGQEKYLPHETWHVVQQAQGRVKPTFQMNGAFINDDSRLEREAGEMEKVITDVTKSHTETPRIQEPIFSATPSLNSVIQRNVGFEFEIDGFTAKTWQVNESGGYGPLSKRARILDGENFYIEADGLPNGNTSWEFVTKDFEENADGLNQLLQVLRKIDGIVQLLRNSKLSSTEKMIYNPVNSRFAQYGTPFNNRYFTLITDNFTVAPQITAGLSLSSLNKVLKSACTGEDLIGYVNSMSIIGKVKDPSGDEELGKIYTAAEKAIEHNPDPNLLALITQLMQIIIGGQNDIGATPKTVMKIALGRTDMKATFNTLPKEIRQPYEKNPQNFVELVMNAVRSTGKEMMNLDDNAPVISGRLFSHKQYAADKRYRTKSPFPTTCRDWLWGIAIPNGRDLLSNDNSETNKLLGSMGALQGKLDPGDRPVFEIRSSKKIYASLIVPYALDFFKYVISLNEPERRQIKISDTELHQMSEDDISEMITFGPNRSTMLWEFGGRTRLYYLYEL